MLLLVLMLMRVCCTIVAAALRSVFEYEMRTHHEAADIMRRCMHVCCTLGCIHGVTKGLAMQRFLGTWPTSWADRCVLGCLHAAQFTFVLGAWGRGLLAVLAIVMAIMLPAHPGTHGAHHGPAGACCADTPSLNPMLLPLLLLLLLLLLLTSPGCPV
jgi:hypothetical protein